MLLDNFIPLINFYPDAQFTDVNGDSIYKYDMLPGATGGRSNQYVYDHSHNFYPSNPCFNYDSNTFSNDYTDEKGLYCWANVVGRQSDNDTRQSPERRSCGFTLFVGTGDTAVTAADYCLDDFVELEVLDASCQHYSDNRTETKRSFKNNTGSSVTINEVGLYFFTMQHYDFGEDDSRNFPVVMIGRKVLTTPVTLAAGDTYTFSYIIDMSNVTFSEVVS